jgi:hypothetical protein
MLSMNNNGFASELVGIEWEAAGTGSEAIRTDSETVGLGSELVRGDSEAVRSGSAATGIDRESVGSEPEASRIGGVSVKEAAAHVGMPVSTMYDWVNRRWVRTIVGLSERGKEQRLVPWSEIERLQGGAKETLLQRSARKGDSGAESESLGSDSGGVGVGSAAAATGSEPTGMDSAPSHSEPESSRSGLESVGIDWKLVAKAEARRVRDLAIRVQFLEVHLAKAEARAEKAEERAEREGHELRILIAQSVQAQQQTAVALSGIEERMALPQPKKASWWKPWRR